MVEGIIRFKPNFFIRTNGMDHDNVHCVPFSAGSGGFSTWFDRKVSCKEEDFQGRGGINF